MKILYITEDQYSKVHINLCKALVESRDDVCVTYLTFDRKSEDKQLFKEVVDNKKLETIVVPCDFNKILYKYVFWYKKYKKWDLINKYVNISDFDIIYASTAFSDGCVAYEAYKRYGIPFVIAIRGTDVNLYIKKMFHLYRLGIQILLNAKMIVCISEAQKVSLKNSLLYQFLENKIGNKIKVIPNGVDDFWIENQYKNQRRKKCRRFLYIGYFSDNKNVLSIIKAFKKVKKKYTEIELYLVGEKGDQEAIIIEECANNDSIVYYGAVYEKNELVKIIRECDSFIMVSLVETFGLVYVEALSQGLPIIYSANTGFDGMIKDCIVGERCNAKNISDIANAMEQMIINYNNYNYCDLARFCWSNIGRTIITNISK